MSEERRLKRLGINPNLPPSEILKELARRAKDPKVKARRLALAERARKIEIPGD